MSKFKEITQSEIPTLVDFYATWCGPCKTMAPILDQVKNDLGAKVRILKIDVDKNPAIANQLQVRGVPTLILYRSGEIKWRQSGVLSASELKTVINQFA